MAGMDAHEAFVYLVRSARRRKKGTKGRQAILQGADYIRQMSGSWHPDDMLWITNPKECEQLAVMLKEEGLE